MRRMLIAVTLVLCQVAHAQAQPEPLRGSPRDVAAAKNALDGWWTASMNTKDQRLAWWREARFGCFIHWGVYADPAGEFHGKRSGSYSEHIMRSNTIPLEVYKKEIVANFNPTRFNADEWADLFASAGMKYVVITAKHHDGLAMYPSDAYPYDIRLTKFKRDPMRELADACRKRGLRFGFYYSHAFDWEHPDAPGNDWDYDQPGGDKKLHGGDRWYDEHPDWLGRAARNYVDKKAIPQLLELIHNYKPDILWFDTSGKLPFSEQIRIVEACRKADPNVVINGRAARGVGKNWGDYTNTGDNPQEVRGNEGDWESIPTVNGSYGYHQFDKNFKTPEFFIQLIAKVAAKGGNTLLNIGPMGNGEIDPDSKRILQGIGQWMNVYGESIHGTTRTPLDRQAWGDTTLKGDTLYLHIFQWPKDDKLVVGGLLTDATEGTMLNAKGKSGVKAERLNANDVLVWLAPGTADPTDTVIALKLNGPIKTKPGYLLATNIATNRLLAFDGVLNAENARYGDGKANRYYIWGLTKPDDSLSWPVRLNAPATFEVAIKYSTAFKEQTGTYTVSAGRVSLPGHVRPTTGATTPQDVTLGKLQLPAGETEIRITPTEVHGGDLMNVFEINLKPLAE